MTEIKQSDPILPLPVVVEEDEPNTIEEVFIPVDYVTGKPLKPKTKVVYTGYVKKMPNMEEVKARIGERPYTVVSLSNEYKEQLTEIVSHKTTEEMMRRNWDKYANTGLAAESTPKLQSGAARYNS